MNIKELKVDSLREVINSPQSNVEVIEKFRKECKWELEGRINTARTEFYEASVVARNAANRLRILLDLPMVSATLDTDRLPEEL